MGICKRCKKFFLFTKFENGMCPICVHENAIEIQAEKNRLRIEAEAAALEAEKQRIQESLRNLRAPGTINGLYPVYRYDDVDITPVPGSLENPKYFPGNIVEVVSASGYPNAPSDAAISVDGCILGFLPRNRLSDMVVDWKRDNKPTWAAIRSVDKTTGKAQIYLFFYDIRRIDKFLHRNPNPRKYRLTGNRNKDMQESIWCCEEGMECEVEFDDYKEKYLVRCDGMEIGYLPAAAEKYSESGPCFIASIETDENDKRIVYLYLF